MVNSLNKIVRFSTECIVYWLAFFLLATGHWVNKKFGAPTFDQVFFHIQCGLEGLVDTDPALVESFIDNCVLVPLMLALLILFYKRFIFSVKRVQTSQGFLNFFYTISRLIFRAKLSFILLLLSTVFFLSKIYFWEYIKNRDESTFIAENYISPKDIIAPKIKKNLVLIYVESFENTYSNKNIFQEDLLSSLNSKTAQAVSFKNYRDSVGSTMAALIGSQCGIPLKAVMLSGSNYQNAKLKQFLPNTVCLGDILQEAGYKNIFMSSDALPFAAKDKFFSQHGYTEAYGADEWRSLGEQHFNKWWEGKAWDFSGWGLYDDLLLSQAKKRVAELEKDSTPYNLTVLTIDTHHPSGFISQTCKRKGVTEFTGIIRCTADILADFVDYMSENGYLKNTNLVILGDHLTMPNSVYNKLLTEKNRTVFNRFIMTHSLEKNRDTLYTFSMFPTILYSLGFRFEKNRLGLGASGFGEIDPDFIIDSYDWGVLAEKLASYSKKYLEFWEVKKQK